MKLSGYVTEALLNLSSSKMRSILAVMGILVGTASVVAMVLGGELATNEAIKQFKTLGTDLMSVSISDSQDAVKQADKMESLSLSDATKIKQVDSSILTVAPYSLAFNPVSYEGHELPGTVLGVNEQFAKTVHVRLMKGRFISSWDGLGFYCVIGEKLYEMIKQVSFKDPIGQPLKVGKDMFVIVGVAETWPENSFVYANIDNSVMVPLLAASALTQYATISNIIMKLVPDADIESVKIKVEKYLIQKLGNKQLFFRSAKELIEKMAKQSEILTIFLGLIGSISLLVGGIGVMNIMLVSVVERKREIGIRLAVGAQPKDIHYLFLTEAVLLSFLGGCLGVLVGTLIAYFIALFSHWQFVFFSLPLVIGFTVSVSVGIFFGFYPAYKASQLDPIQALRSEA